MISQNIGAGVEKSFWGGEVLGVIRQECGALKKTF